MDCEKFDQIIVDALYDELDELTLAAAKRHADSCTRCQTAWSGLKATRKVGVLPIVEVPQELENRILSRAREVHRNVAWPKRVGRAVSWAGAFAMRPQTAMAAVLLLVLGASVTLLKVKPDRSGAPSRVSVTERGVPQEAQDEGRPGERALAESRGVMPAPPAAAPAPRKDEDKAKASEVATPTVARAPAAAASRSDDLHAEVARAGRAKPADEPFTEAPPEAELSGPVAAGAPTGAAESPKTAAAPAAADLDRKREAAGAAAPAADPYASAMALYTAGRFAEAEKAFSAVAASGGKNAPYAALYAAKSAEANLGCGSAVTKYENVVSRYGGTSAAPEAQWSAANCYKTLGAVDKARSLYMALRSVAGYRDRAEAELANLAPATRGAAKPARPAAPPPR